MDEMGTLITLLCEWNISATQKQNYRSDEQNDIFKLSAEANPNAKVLPRAWQVQRFGFTKV